LQLLKSTSVFKSIILPVIAFFVSFKNSFECDFSKTFKVFKSFVITYPSEDCS